MKTHKMRCVGREKMMKKKRRKWSEMGRHRSREAAF